jgi:hypothetical protein
MLAESAIKFDSKVDGVYWAEQGDEEMDKIAIHTYYANLQEPQDTNFYFGSVNDLLFQALQ